MRRIGWLLYKDLLVEARGLERLPGLALFSGAVLLTLQFSLPPVSPSRPLIAAGMLWATVVFAALLEVRRALASERQDGTLDGLRASPLDDAALFTAKFASSLVALVVLEAALVPVATMFFGGPASAIAPAIGVCVLGTAGLLGWGTLFAAVAGETRAADVILPVLLFPLLVPQTIAVVRVLAALFTGQPWEPAGLVLLVSFDALSVGTSLLLFGYVLRE